MFNIYYIGSSFGISCIGLGAYYYYDRDGFIDKVSMIAWELTNTYHYINSNINEIFNMMNDTVEITFEDNLESEELNINNDNVEDVEFMGYNIKDDTTYTTKDIIDNKYIIDNTFNVMFITQIIDNNKYFFRIKDKLEIKNNENIEFKKIDKLFLQIEVELNNIKHEIQKNLEYFYLNNNIILDHDFLSWYLIYFYGLTLENDYILHIIDKDINIKKITSGQSIRIFKLNDNKYNYEII